MSVALADDLVLAMDPTVMARRLPELAGADLDPWQVEFLRSADERIILNIGRQLGKSTMTGVLTMHTAIYEPGSLSLLLSPGERQSMELFKKCKAVYNASDRPVRAVSENLTGLELENGSRIISLPGGEATVRGYSKVRLLVVDEASRVPDSLYLAIRPMLAMSHGRLVLLSTPFGKRGFFFREWTSRNPEEPWLRLHVTAEQVARYQSGFLAAERLKGDHYYRQEYLGEFVETDDQLFAYDLVQRSLRTDIEPLFPDLHFESGVLLSDLDDETDEIAVA
jgi:hypothetical protein